VDNLKAQRIITTYCELYHLHLLVEILYIKLFTSSCVWLCGFLYAFCWAKVCLCSTFGAIWILRWSSRLLWFKTWTALHLRLLDSSVASIKMHRCLPTMWRWLNISWRMLLVLTITSSTAGSLPCFGSCRWLFTRGLYFVSIEKCVCWLWLMEVRVGGGLGPVPLWLVQSTVQFFPGNSPLNLIL